LTDIPPESHRERENSAVNPNKSDIDAAEQSDAAMEVLRSHVPLSLLMDIASAGGPDSEQIAAVEGGDADWLQATE
jgi:hypothetical protein